jgi:hypothetical protein
LRYLRKSALPTAPRPLRCYLDCGIQHQPKTGKGDALKDYEDQHVAVIVAVDPDTGDLHIIQVEVPQQ